METGSCVLIGMSHVCVGSSGTRSCNRLLEDDDADRCAFVSYNFRSTWSIAMDDHPTLNSCTWGVVTWVYIGHPVHFERWYPIPPPY